ncbi:MAG: rhomboid family intramembrane serine protease [Deltaproteobacteria bacterium]|nr:rhomboid family intramembrane serine protease [Deltaproteobacteria bacterium]
MIPLRDHLRQAPPPHVNYCLITLNFLVFAWELSLGFRLPKATQILGFIPARFVGYFHHSGTAFSQAVMPLLTSLFLHGNLLHFLPNMCFLFIFGGKVEDVLGPGRYLLFYLTGGVGAGLIYFLVAPSSAVPLIGASGAIAAVMAAYFSLFPGERFSTLFIITWVLLQFFYATFALMSKSTGQAGMAWWAHVGGFLLGLVLIHLLAPRAVRLLPFRSRPQKPPVD